VPSTAYDLAANTLIDAAMKRGNGQWMIEGA
jgi:hypothetical protein